MSSAAAEGRLLWLLGFGRMMDHVSSQSCSEKGLNHILKGQRRADWGVAFSVH